MKIATTDGVKQSITFLQANTLRMCGRSKGVSFSSFYVVKLVRFASFGFQPVNNV